MKPKNKYKYERKSSFRKSLDLASKIVNSWPEWKKQVLEQVNNRYRKEYNNEY